MAISKLACKTISSPNYTKVANKKISSCFLLSVVSIPAQVIMELIFSI